MTVKALIFGTDNLYPKLKPFYTQAMLQGNFEISGYAIFAIDGIKYYKKEWGGR